VTQPTKTIRLAEARFRPGDILAHHSYWPDNRPISFTAQAIAEIARGFIHHVAVLDWTQRGWVAIEMVPPVGREEDIRPRIEKYPGTIAWLRVPDSVSLRFGEGESLEWIYDRSAAVAKARSYIGVQYGFDTIKRDYLVSSWGRWFVRLPNDEELPDLLPVCSVLALDAIQTGFGGVDLIRDLNLALTQPEDVHRLCILDDMGVLVP